MNDSFLPNIDSEEKIKRMKELIYEQGQRRDAIVRFVNENVDDIRTALHLAIKNDMINGDTRYEDDNGDYIDILEAFNDRMRQWNKSCHDVAHFVSTGELFKL